MSYIAGYIAYKFKLEHPELGTKTSDIPWYEPTTFPWLEALSRGGLRQPTDHFFGLIQKYEEIFQSVHGNGISFEPNVIKNLQAKILASFPESKPAVALKYAKTRTHIRLKYLNASLRASQESAKARDSKQLHQFLH